MSEMRNWLGHDRDGEWLMRLIMAAALIVLSGCTTEAIYMKEPKTGQVATCRAHPLAFPIYATVAAAHDQDCAQDYKDQGYVRVPGP